MNYTHDGDGWRVKKDQVSGSTYDKVQWRSLGGDILVETDLAGNNPTEYIYFAGKRIARRDSSGTVYYFLQDHLGSTRVITNSSGSIVRDSDYYPHGTEKLVSGTVDDPHKFAGMYLDSESGLYYTWFRMYSPNLGRWLAPDPIAGDTTNPGSLNRYAYVVNNPTNFVDPLGLYSPKCSYNCPPEPYIPDYSPFFDPAGYTPPNPYGDPGGCNAPGGNCGENTGSGGGGGGTKAPLSPGDQKKYDENKEKALDDIFNADCLAFLLSHGIDPVQLAATLEGQQAYNGSKSTITKAAAQVGIPGRGSTVAQAFANNPGVHAAASLNGTDVYFRQNNFFSSLLGLGNGNIQEGTIEHEGLHNGLKLGDTTLQSILGLKVNPADTSNITKELRNNKCTH